nr:hybrid sensor histidine kinase/response regulator [Gammaproteobacteria bacterium]
AAVAFRPHIVFLDVGMPKLAGNEAAQRIRDQSSANGTLLVALAGWSPRDLGVRADMRAFDAHLTKPVDYRSVRRLLREVVAE